ncbi:MAG: 16S rRNA (adenine(1518)-N(6)/adenine(1519)-N(6))-dimethyltransferase [Tenericutes bacterium HGW-Tenericutes-1]|jgi:16S rRNA (adenine1518-N6/adenine1519-N6)-dimethyltransferase|nr:MAG: 16S rRNA (adenine(1518)-N(6)/adenine(1519)-N(6))-dimethyltransferase [Tenericutes bacterium HGW-Tenericutes-1]
MSSSDFRDSVKDLLSNNQFRIKKHLGQNFLKDRNILQKIVKEAKIDKTVGVIEVGPGLGSLTEYLIDSALKVVAYEIDNELVPILKNRFSQADNLELLHKDILSVEIDKDIDQYFTGCNEIVVVANLPYYITTPILMRFLESSKKVNRMILMMQSEVGMRVTSKPSTKDYNALTVVINYRAETKYLFKVPKTVFVPEPNVDSAIIEIKIRNFIERKPNNESFFFDFVHRCFTQRRKTLLNNLRDSYSQFDRAVWETLLIDMGYNPTIRAEALSIDDFIKLSDRVDEMINR